MDFNFDKVLDEMFEQERRMEMMKRDEAEFVNEDAYWTEMEALENAANEAAYYTRFA